MNVDIKLKVADLEIPFTFFSDAKLDVMIFSEHLYSGETFQGYRKTLFIVNEDDQIIYKDKHIVSGIESVSDLKYFYIRFFEDFMMRNGSWLAYLKQLLEPHSVSVSVDVSLLDDGKNYKAVCKIFDVDGNILYPIGSNGFSIQWGDAELSPKNTEEAFRQAGVLLLDFLIINSLQFI
jgi:hypothetical protein